MTSSSQVDAGQPARVTAGPSLDVEWYGRVPYGRALAMQEQARLARARGEGGDRLLLLEHPPVVTLGRSAHGEHLLLSPDEYAARGIEVFEAARGGDVTFHAPGQLVGYLVVDLDARGERDLHLHVRRIEQALMTALVAFGLETKRVDGRSGVFVAGASPDRKLASIGVGVKRWVTWHGFALNVTTDLEGFGVIVPCGLDDVTMTSVARETGRSALGLDVAVREAVARAFAETFGCLRPGEARR